MIRDVRYRLARRKGFVALIEILVVLAIIVFLAYRMYGSYFKKSAPVVEPSGSPVVSDQNIDVSHPRAAVNYATQKVNELNKKIEEREKQAAELGF